MIAGNALGAGERGTEIQFLHTLLKKAFYESSQKINPYGLCI